VPENLHETLIVDDQYGQVRTMKWRDGCDLCRTAVNRSVLREAAAVAVVVAITVLSSLQVTHGGWKYVVVW
jgi:hypothetical protein